MQIKSGLFILSMGPAYIDPHSVHYYPVLSSAMWYRGPIRLLPRFVSYYVHNSNIPPAQYTTGVYTLCCLSKSLFLIIFGPKEWAISLFRCRYVRRHHRFSSLAHELRGSLRPEAFQPITTRQCPKDLAIVGVA
jgi:hypothetical protein